MSVEFFGVGGPGQIGNLKKTEKTATAKTDSSSGSDQVTFSSVLQGMNKAQGSSGNSERTEKIAELKAQISEGSYKPDLEKVASSLLQFLVEGK